MKTKFLRLCYFRKITSEETRDIIADFRNEQVDRQKCCQISKKQIRQTYPVDWFKVFLMVLSLVILACSITALFLFLMSYNTAFGTVTHILYALYPIHVLCIVIGMIGHRITLREYKYHWICFFVQLVATASVYLYIFGTIADALKGF